MVHSVTMPMKWLCRRPSKFFKTQDHQSSAAIFPLWASNGTTTAGFGSTALLVTCNSAGATGAGAAQVFFKLALP